MELIYYPDPRLREVARRVEKVDEELRQAVAGMFEVMYRTRGIGLASPQVGLGWRIVVANLAADPQRKDQEQVFVNPEIVEKSGELREEEGCLSLPGLRPVIQRAEKVAVHYQDLEGKDVKRTSDGLEARLFQHEIDHLDGILIVDKMTPADKKQWAELLKELERDYKRKRKPRRGGNGKSGL